MHNFQSLFCQSLYVHTILGLARGKRPIAYRKIGISKLFTHNFRPSFGLNLQKYIISGGSLWPPEIYNFWWSQGAAVLFIRECVFLVLGNHYLRKLSCKLNTHNSGPFWSKFTEIYNFWWLRGGSPSFHKRMCISGEP